MFVIYDQLSPKVARNNYNWSGWRRFKDFWNLQDSNYYTERMYYWRDYSPVYDEEHTEFRKFLNILGLKWEDLLASDIQTEFHDNEVEHAYMYLFPPEDQEEEHTPEQEVDSLPGIPSSPDDPGFPSGYTTALDITYGGRGGYIVPGDDTRHIKVNQGIGDPLYQDIPSMTPEEIQQAVMADVGNMVLGLSSVGTLTNKKEYVLFNENPVEQHTSFGSARKEYPYKPCIEIACKMPFNWYVLFDDNQDTFTVTSMTSPSITYDNRGNKVITWRVEFTSKGFFTSSSPCISNFLDKFNELKDYNRRAAPLPIKETQKHYEQSHNRQSRFEDWFGANGLLKVSAMETNKKEEFMDLLPMAIDFDVEIEEPEWWEKALGLIVVVAGAVVGVIFCCTGGGTSLISIGTGLMYASVTWTVGALALGAIAGPSAFGIVKFIGSMAQISSITGSLILMFNSLRNMFKSSGKWFTDLFNVNPLDNAIKTPDKIDLNMPIEDRLKQVVDLDVLDNLTTYFTSAEIASPEFKRMLVKVLEEKKLVGNHVRNGLRIYRNYERLFVDTDHSMSSTTEEESRNEENAPSTLDKVLGDKVFVYSLGSFDALSTLDLKIKSQIGDNTIKTDPTSSIT